MKKSFFTFVLLFSIVSHSQYLQFNSMTASPIENGINVNVKVTTLNGAGYLNHSYTVVGSDIYLTVCYWFNITLPIYQIENDFPIIVPDNQQNYTIHLATFNSSSQTTCDNFSAGPRATSTYLETDKFSSENLKIAPNPFSSTFEINSNLPIAWYKLYDIVGKQIISVNYKQDLEAQTASLKSGVYLLELIFDNNKSNIIKLIKN